MMKKILVLIFLLSICANAYAKVLPRLEQQFYDTFSVQAPFVRLSGDSSFIAHTLTKDAGTAGTPVVLSADTTLVTRITIRPRPTNAAKVYIGPSTMTKVASIVLSGDDIITIPVDSTSDIYMDTDVAGDGIGWIGIVQ